MAEFVLIPALLFGVVIAIIEMSFVHSDEIGMGWFNHGMHAVPFAILFTFINMNVGLVLPYLTFIPAETIWVDLGVRAVISIIAMAKIQTAAAIAGRVGEKFHHTFMIGMLILAAPYLWEFVLAPMGLIPNWI